MGRCCECINVCVCAPNKRPRDWDDEEEENEKKKKKEDNDGVEHDGDGDDELEEEWWVIDSPDETWRLEPGGQFRASKCNPPGGHKENRSGRIVWRQDD